MITQDQADHLLTHIQEVAEADEFGFGPDQDRTKDYVLGEDGLLGIIRNGNSGQRTGAGNGVKLQDGTGLGTGLGRGGSAKGAGAGRGAAGGQGMMTRQASGECIINN